MAYNRPFHRRNKGRRIEDCLREALLIFRRQAQQFCLIDSLARCSTSSGHNEICQCSALNLGRALQKGVHLKREPRFKAGHGRDGR